MKCVGFGLSTEVVKSAFMGLIIEVVKCIVLILSTEVAKCVVLEDWMRLGGQKKI